MTFWLFTFLNHASGLIVNYSSLHVIAMKPMFDLIIFLSKCSDLCCLWNKQFLIFHIKTILKSLFFMFHSEMHHIMDVKQAVNAVDFEEVLLCFIYKYKKYIYSHSCCSNSRERNHGSLVWFSYKEILNIFYHVLSDTTYGKIGLIFLEYAVSVTGCININEFLFLPFFFFFFFLQCSI